MNNFFLYARKSTDEADRQILSIDSQMHELNELARKEKFNIVQVFTESQTAKEPGRPIFNAMISRIERGEAQGIISWHPDRLARNSVDGGRIIYLIDTGKLLWLKFPTFWFESTPQGKFMLNIAFGQSKYMVDNLVENVKRGHRAKLRRGIWPTLAPFGYLNNRLTKMVVPDPEAAPFVKKVFDLYSTGEFTLEELADKANGLGLMTKRKIPNKIHISRITRILTNPFYYGLIRWNGEDHEGTHEPLISRELFNLVQRILAQRGAYRGRKKGFLKDFVFRGVFQCGECGSGITAETQKLHNYYRCTRKKGLCFQPFMREEFLSDKIRAEVEKLAMPEDWADKKIAEINNRKKTLAQSSSQAGQALKDELVALDAQLNRLLDLYVGGELEKVEYHAKRSDLVARKMDLKAELERLGRPGNERLEQLLDFVNWAKELNKAVISYEVRALASALKKSSSNRRILARKLFLTVEAPYSFLAEGNATGNWSG